MFRLRAHAAACLVLVSLPRLAHATYSISALDTATGELGGAGASCVPYAVDLIYGVVAGKGVLNAQASYDEAAKLYAVSLLSAGASAEQTLAALTEPGLFRARDAMQFGIVDANGGVAPFTGSEALPYAGHLTGESADGRYKYSIQGNILTSRAVLEQMQQGFGAAGCDLAERLMRALEAAADAGAGDSRCTPEARPANSAYLDVTAPSGTRVHLSVPDVSPADPTPELRRLYESFRVEVPCPAEPPSASSTSPRAASPRGCQVGSRAGYGRASLGLVLALALALALGRRRRTL